MLTPTTRTLRDRAGAVYVVTYDAYDTVDTITKNGRLLVGTHRDARRVLAKADAILKWQGLPTGWTWERS